MEISSKILDIIFDYALDKFDETAELHAQGRAKFLEVIDRFVEKKARLDMCLPAFPFKSANKVEKVLGTLPDKAEELALERLNTMCKRIEEIYEPGAKVLIISDGLTYNDLLSISDQDTWQYGEALREMAIEKGFTNVDFTRIRDLIKGVPGPEKLNEITYVANATNFRRALMDKHGDDNIDIDKEIAENEDTRLTYCGYQRFLENDLRHIFPVGEGLSATQYRKNVKYIAKQMLIRGHAFAAAIKEAFPDYLRLSIHKSSGANKISISLLNTETSFTTPWHCSVAQKADGEWTSAPKGDFEADEKFEVVEEDGQPSHFGEKAGKDETDTKADNKTEGQDSAKAASENVKEVKEEKTSSTADVLKQLRSIGSGTVYTLKPNNEWSSHSPGFAV